MKILSCRCLRISSIKLLCSDTNVKVDAVTRDVVKLNKDNGEIKDDMKRIKEENQELKKGLVELEQYSRKGNVIINGVTSEVGEDVKSIVKKIAGKLETDLQDSNISAAHSLPSKNKIPP